MDNIIDLIATDSSPSEVSDNIKAALFAKSSEKIDQIRPYIANALFGIEDSEDQDYTQDQEEGE
jgi:hypothetical protein